MGDDTDAVSTDAVQTDDHLDDIEDGAGCTEIWERLSEQRSGASD